MFAITRFLYVEVQSFPYVLLLLRGEETCFVIPKTSLYEGSLKAGLTVLEIYLSLATLY